MSWLHLRCTFPSWTCYWEGHSIVAGVQSTTPFVLESYNPRCAHHSWGTVGKIYEHLPVKCVMWLSEFILNVWTISNIIFKIIIADISCSLLLHPQMLHTSPTEASLGSGEHASAYGVRFREVPVAVKLFFFARKILQVFWESIGILYGDDLLIFILIWCIAIYLICTCICISIPKSLRSADFFNFKMKSEKTLPCTIMEVQ